MEKCFKIISSLQLFAVLAILLHEVLPRAVGEIFETTSILIFFVASFLLALTVPFYYKILAQGKTINQLLLFLNIVAITLVVIWIYAATNFTIM